jgi:hypothetical protein
VEAKIMTTANPPRRISGSPIAGAAVALTGVAILLLDLFDVAWFTTPFKLAGPLILLAAIAALIITRLRDWRRTDEVVQAAQKSAALWGGLSGAAAWLVLIWSPLPVQLTELLTGAYANLDPARVAAFAGGLMFVACTFTGYALALVIWWRGKR